uniref:Putative outer membrane OmpA/MotB protein n=1 Tax=mine drainage metagenome TaxID=410659 RepID=E6QK16_9ZZZZ
MRRPLPYHSGNRERWLVSYADFITLLFAFFVVLYASSKADQKKQAQVAEAIDSAFHALGIFPEAGRLPNNLKNVSAISKDDPISPMTIVMGEDVLAPAQVRQDLDQVGKHMQQLLADQIAQHTVSVQMGKDGLVISLREAGFFTSGSAAPEAQTLPILRQVAEALGKTRYELRIEGHTDNVPIHNAQFDSNWELSSARATRLARIFLATGAIPPSRISAAGYAEFHPVAPNDTAAGRAQNRRVDLIILPQTKVNLAMPDGDATKASWHRITDE